MRALIIAAATLMMALPAFAADELKQGDEAPSFSFQSTNDKTVTKDTYKGKQAVVIAWFPKAFTGGCTKECKSMKESSAALKAYDVAYFTASCDTVEDNKKFAESLGLDFPILSDPTRESAKAFGVLGPKGNANRVTFYIGKDGKILFVDKAVKTETHGPDMAAKLGELGVAKK